MGESAKHRVAQPIVHLKFDWRNVPSACVVEGDEELTLRGNDCGTQQLLTNTARIQANKCRPPFGQDDCAAFCQALYQCGAWGETHSTVLAVAKCQGIKKAGERVAS